MKKKSTKIYLVYVAVLLAATLAIWGYAFIKAKEYQATRPETLVQTEMSKLIHSDLTTYERDFSKEGMSYKITDDGLDIARVNLKVSDKKGLVGFPLYEVESVEGLVSADAYAVNSLALSLNGQAWNAAEEVVLPELEALDASGVVTLPKLAHFHAEGMTYAPDIASDIETVSEKNEDGALVFSLPVSESAREEVTSFAKAFASDYAYFQIGELPWSTFSNHLIPGSPLRANLQSIASSWYIQYVSSKMSEIEVTNLKSYGGGLYSCDISLEFVVYGEHRVNNFDISVRCYIVKQGGAFKVCEMLMKQ